MRAFGKFLGRAILGLALLLAAIWFFGPREPMDTEISFDASALGDDLDGYLSTQESRFDDIVPGTHKRIIWAGDTGVKTPLSVVYIHGWSATSEELRPVPDMVAKALGANLYYTRLTGHGRDGEALAAATAGDWIEDAAEAMAIGRRLGERVILFGTSTGGTLVAELAASSVLNADLAGAAFVSPNFKIADSNAPLLTLPFARFYVPMVGGETRSWAGTNEMHTLYWTRSYPTVAVLPLAVLVKHAATLDYAAVKTPGLFIYNMKDNVVLHERTKEVIKEWGGPTRIMNPEVPDDEMDGVHVLAGDILSPTRTGPVAAEIINWARGL